MLTMLLAMAAGAPAGDVRAQDIVLARVGYRLAARNAALCGASGRPAGLAVERLSQYPIGARREMLAAGIGVLPTVTIVVPGSPAAAAGVQVGDQIGTVDGVAETPEDPDRAPRGHGPVAAFEDRLDAALDDGMAALTVQRAGAAAAVTLSAAPGCAARFTVRQSSKLTSYADGLTIQVTMGVMLRAASDAELAAVVAHELAHNILRHPQRLKALGRPRGQVRASELAADRLSVYLLEAAGYPFTDAVRFMTAILRQSDWGFLSDGTHPGWRERIAAMTSERARIDAQLARGEPVRPPPDLAAPTP